MLAVFLSILSMVVFQQVDLLLFALLFCIVLVNIVASRLWKGSGVARGIELFAKCFNQAVVLLALTVTYFVAVGLVFVLSRLCRKRFIDLKGSGWVEKKPIGKDGEMF